MATAGWLVPNRPEVYNPKGDASGRGEIGLIGRVLDRMRPDEGWASLPLVLMLVGTMAWSISDARWILGQDGLSSFLIWIAFAAAAWGYVSARLDLSPWLAHTLGCTIGAFVLIEVIGASLPNSEPGLAGWFHTTAVSVTQAYLDLTWRHQVSTLQVGHFCLILGVVVWGTAQAASYDVFGYHRSVNGVLLLAVALIANMALTEHDQFIGLVVFSAAALVLLLLAHASDERTSWLRHRIWRGRDFQAPHLQGGLAFASAAVAGSLVLTMLASSAPLQPVFKDMDANVQSAFGWMNGLLPGGGDSRVQSTADFGANAPVRSSFSELPHPVFTVRVQSTLSSFHWRMVTYDTFQTTGWKIGDNSHQDQVIPGGQLGAGTLDQVGPTTRGRRDISVVVHVQDTSIKHLIAVNEPYGVNAPAQRTLVGTGPSSANIAWINTDAADYTVSAYAPDTDPGGTGLTEWLLQHAGVNYPPGLKTRYTQGADLVKSDGQQLLAAITNWARNNGNAFTNEFDVAKAIQAYLQASGNFTYSTDISGLMPRCQGLSTVDCFAYLREGFCEQYATTMTMLMRMAGYPARYVLGYLPGSIDPHTLVQQVTSQQKHAWVEVYFPNFGWIPFDPTGGGVGHPTVIQPGSAVTATPTPSDSFEIPGTNAGVAPSHSLSPEESGTTKNSSAGPPPYFLVPAVLFLIILFALIVMWRRRPKRLDGPDTVYRNVVKLASRMGYKPAPTQTVYEYTGMLADIVPKARDSLGVVAVAAVESTYGKRQLGSDRLMSLAAAHQTVRQALLRLAMRVPRLRRRKGKPNGSAGRRGKSGGPKG
jgi:transglutaminase-like putative cysteine protease